MIFSKFTCMFKTLIVGTRLNRGSNEYPQSMFWIKNKKNRLVQFAYIKVRFKGIYITWTCFLMFISMSGQKARWLALS